MAKAYGALRRAYALVRRGADLFPFTPLGLVAVAAAGFALVRYGVRRVDLLYLVIGAVGLGLGLLCALLTSIVAIGLWLRLRARGAAALPPLRLECGVRAATGFSAASLWYLPLAHVSWSWLRPEGAVRLRSARGRLEEEVTPSLRGLDDHIDRRVVVSDPFALTRIAFVQREPRAVRVIPSVGSLKQVQILRSISGGEDVYHPAGPPEGERVDMRGYAAGDPVRFILWKVFAKTGQLVIRTPERALSPARQTIAYMVAGDGDEPAAGAARMAVESGALGARWVLGADGNEKDATTAGDALEVLARSAQAGPSQWGAGLSPFLKRATPGGTARAVVFVPGRPGPWIERVVAAARARGGPLGTPLQFIVCTDGIERDPEPSLVRRAMVRASAATRARRTQARDVTAVVDALTATRSGVLLLDRAHGRVYTKGHRRAPLQLVIGPERRVPPSPGPPAGAGDSGADPPGEAS
jgi:hypothetical protein